MTLSYACLPLSGMVGEGVARVERSVVSA
jgi:hypothetical protein